jgi:hypothetical protein
MKLKGIYFLLFSTLLIFCNNRNAIISDIVPIKWNKLSDIPVPIGFERRESSIYGKWIRNIKLSGDNIVYYYNGSKKYNQKIHVAVLNFDIGDRDLQQCADACMRIRGEYLFENKKYDNIKYLFANGKWVNFSTYTSKRDYKSFRRFMSYVYAFANTASLKKQLNNVTNSKNVKIGDVFVQAGNPYGHAITVMDICINQNGDKMMMISQSYMPAQSIEILRNEANNSAWFPVNFGDELNTPEWTFTKNDLHRF